MTSSQFTAWRQTNYRSRRAAALALGIRPETVAKYETEGGIPLPIALACWALDRRLPDYVAE